MKEIAVFGGTFDPPTRAHEAIIRAALALPDIDEVWVMPSGQRSDKPDMLPDETRLSILRTMCKESFHDNPRLKLTDFEMRLPKPTETTRTVAALETSFPDRHFLFIFGADSYYDMPNWHEGQRLQKNLGMLLVGRQGFAMPVALNVQPLSVAHDADLSISSTKAREVLRQGGDIKAFVSDGVARVLKTHHYYRLITSLSESNA